MLCMNSDQATGEAFIIGGEEYVPLKELFRLIAEELGVKPPKLKIPMSRLIYWQFCARKCVLHSI